MWNVFEQPWLLTAIAIGSFLLIGTLRSLFPKIKAWVRIVPVLILLAAFGLDYGVQTDHEQVVTTLNKLLRAAEQQDAQAIGLLVSTDYQDSYHSSKQRLMSHLKSRFSGPIFEKIKKLSLDVAPFQGNIASAALNSTVVFDSNSTVAQLVGKSLIARVEFQLTEQANGQWLLSNMELREVNRQPVNWRQAAGQF